MCAARRSIGRAPFGAPKETDFSLSGDWKATRFAG